jgi:hypothetical protein
MSGQFAQALRAAFLPFHFLMNKSFKTFQKIKRGLSFVSATALDQSLMVSRSWL